MTGLDWGGPNAAWERESMRLLAHEVMPKFRQHVLARAAEAPARAGPVGTPRSTGVRTIAASARDQKSEARPLTSQSP